MNLYLVFGILNILMAATGGRLSFINLIVGFLLLVKAFGGFGPFEEEKKK